MRSFLSASLEHTKEFSALVVLLTPQAGRCKGSPSVLEEESILEEAAEHMAHVAEKFVDAVNNNLIRVEMISFLALPWTYQAASYFTSSEMTKESISKRKTIEESLHLMNERRWRAAGNRFWCYQLYGACVLM